MFQPFGVPVICQSVSFCALPPCTMYVQNTEGISLSTLGCSLHLGDIVMSTLGGYPEYIRGCSVHQNDTMSTPGGYLDECGDIMSTLGDIQYTGVSIQNQFFFQ